MRALTAAEILRIWELGQVQHPVDRALTLLAAGSGLLRETLAALSVGQRDAQLLALRELTFGAALNSFAECPQCRERLEFALDTTAIRAPRAQETAFEWAIADLVVHFRLPDSRDLAALAGCPNPAEARRLLAQRCVLAVRRQGAAMAGDELPEEVMAQLAAHIEACDPQAEVLIDLTCPVCGHRWQALFDIAAFFWTEIGAQAKRLLRDVHSLASVYHWREADILALSAVRRRCYLEMVS